MLSTEKFELLTSGSESSILDFKRSFYRFSSEVSKEETAKFVKDVVSFCNTIRQETAFIIVGIEEKDGKRIKHGIDAHIDDSILQDKIKDKVFPRPIFSYYELMHENKSYGILEFPVIKYEMPLTSKKKIPGMEVDVIYHRLGTMNCEANGFEAIKINDWLRSLPSLNLPAPRADSIELLKRLTSGVEKLSTLFADIYQYANGSNNPSLLKFCDLNLRGLNDVKVDDARDFDYRIQSVMISLVEIKINQSFGKKVTQREIKREMKEDPKYFRNTDFLFAQSLTNIENHLSRTESLSYLTQSASTIFDDADESELLYVYIFRDEWEMVYGKIRQKAIDMLLMD